jgi:D-alanyl-D-alanine carboxypeptidase (penicillin-binding protein 5/6)
MRWLTGLCLALLAGALQAQTNPFSDIAGAYWLEVNGSPVWSKQADKRLAPASLTKMMTALLVLEDGSALSSFHALVRVSATASQETGSRIGLKASESLTVEDLLAATLIASANDACRALADGPGGGQTQFVARMNTRARELGMRQTQFANACGHDAKGHFSSARDLALLANALVKFPQVLVWAGRVSHTIRSAGGRTFTLNNTNALMGRYKGAVGLKTGHTARAGNCLVAIAQRGDTRVVLVMLHASDRWWDAVDLLNMAFDHGAP